MCTNEQVKAVFLDAAHTILELSRPYPRMLHFALNKYGFEHPYNRVEQVLRSEWSKVEHLFNGKHEDTRMSDERDRQLWGDFYRMMLSSLGIDAYPTKLLDEIYAQFGDPNNWTLFPETLDTIRSLKKLGYTVGIGSNWDSHLPKILKTLKVLDEVDTVVVSAIIGHRKPAREFFEAECEQVGLEPHEVMHVGDHPDADVHGAVTSGLRATLVWRREGEPKLEHDVPVIDDLTGLLGVLQSSGTS
ncbi:MAG: HAD family hydrolase [Planctomycetota bacterium]|nr:HAD family hydrolase [Planctomycetota bacterium]